MTTIDQTKTFDRASRASAYAASNGLTEGQYSIEKHGKLYHVLLKKADETEAPVVTVTQGEGTVPYAINEGTNSAGEPAATPKAPKKAKAPKAEKAAKAPKKAKAAKAEKAPRAALEEANGIKRPKPEGQTGQVWAYCDEQHKKIGTAPTRADALEALQAKGVNFHTVSTQYGRWRKFMGISGRLPKAGE